MIVKYKVDFLKSIIGKNSLCGTIIRIQLMFLHLHESSKKFKLTSTYVSLRVNSNHDSIFLFLNGPNFYWCIISSRLNPNHDNFSCSWIGLFHLFRFMVAYIEISMKLGNTLKLIELNKLIETSHEFTLCIGNKSTMLLRVKYYLVFIYLFFIFLIIKEF